MIVDFILRDLRRQGVVIPDAVGSATVVATHQNYGGEKVYVPKLPKLQKQARLQQVHVSIGDGCSPKEAALATGISVRHVRRLQRGR